MTRQEQYEGYASRFTGVDLPKGHPANKENKTNWTPYDIVTLISWCDFTDPIYTWTGKPYYLNKARKVTIWRRIRHKFGFPEFDTIKDVRLPKDEDFYYVDKDATECTINLKQGECKNETIRTRHNT